MNLKKVAEQFAIQAVIRVSPYGNGRIHKTFLVETTSGDCYILQKLHSIFSQSLLLDIDAATQRLARKGLLTPRIIKTLSGKLGWKNGKDLWRMLTYIPGITIEKTVDPQTAKSAGALVGTFHAALVDWKYKFKHALRGFHDTKAIMKKLEETTRRFKGKRKYNVLYPLAQKITHEYRGLKNSPSALPKRVIHGDLKISNARFGKMGKNAISLLDLDTLQRGALTIDIGDAARSWCNRGCEEDVGNSCFDLDIFEALMRGYLQTAQFLTKKEIEAIPDGIATIILELSARFVTDAFEEKYFTLDSDRFPSLYEQNKTKALAQIKLFDDFKNKRREVAMVINSCK